MPVLLISNEKKLNTFSTRYIFATCCCRPIDYFKQWILTDQSLKYQRFTPSGWVDIGIKMLKIKARKTFFSNIIRLIFNSQVHKLKFKIINYKLFLTFNCYEQEKESAIYIVKNYNSIYTIYPAGNAGLAPFTFLIVNNRNKGYTLKLAKRIIILTFILIFKLTIDRYSLASTQ